MTQTSFRLVPSGFCQCGCGEKTPLAGVTRTERGWVKGEPLPFVNGRHARRHPLSTARKAAISAALQGRTLSDDHKAELAAAQRRRYESDAEREKQRGEKSPLWTGDDVGYQGAHHRAKRALMGQPCAHEDDTCKGQLEAAFNHDTPPDIVKVDSRDVPYSSRPEDYIRLCLSHHRRYDNQNRNRVAA